MSCLIGTSRLEAFNQPQTACRVMQFLICVLGVHCCTAFRCKIKMTEKLRQDEIPFAQAEADKIS